MSIIASLIEAMFGCAHRRTTFPISIGRAKGQANRTYIVCLDCGREFDYDWSALAVRQPERSNPPAVPHWRLPKL